LTGAGTFVSRSLPEARRFARYLIVGAAANLFGLAIYYLATLAIGVEPKRALTLASAIAFVPAYAANRAWTFRSDAGTARSLPRYGAGYAASFVLQVSILHLGVDLLGQRHEWVVLFGLGVTTVFFFLLQRLWVFPGRRPGGCDKPRRLAL
jgi:putative flippase GtrA